MSEEKVSIELQLQYALDYGKMEHENSEWHIKANEDLRCQLAAKDAEIELLDSLAKLRDYEIEQLHAGRWM